MKAKGLFICFLEPNIDMKFYVRYDFWKGVSDAANKKGITLITFVGDEIQESTSNDKRTNFVYELIDITFFDGVLVWSSALSNQVGAGEFENFSKRFSSLPIVDLEPKINDKLSS